MAGAARAALSVTALLEWVLALNLDLVVQPRRDWPGSDVAVASADIRLLGAYRQADTRTREAVAAMLGIDRPHDPPVRLTREGRPPGPSRTVPVAYAQESAACFGCVAGDRLTPAGLSPATAGSEAFDAAPSEVSRAAG